jgi:hypothetical protein
MTKMSLDLSESIVPRSDQINADDLIGGPITVTVRDVRKGAAEQPFDFMLLETDRAYRPSKTMRRLIVAAWGPDATAYAGRRLTLYREPSIKFGGQTVGGIRISHMSHIPRRFEEKLQTARGKREAFTVEPLPDEVRTVSPSWDVQVKIAEAMDLNEAQAALTELWRDCPVDDHDGRHLIGAAIERWKARKNAPVAAPPVDLTDPLVQQEAEEWAAQQTKLNQPEGQ